MLNCRRALLAALCLPFTFSAPVAAAKLNAPEHNASISQTALRGAVRVRQHTSGITLDDGPATVSGTNSSFSGKVDALNNKLNADHSLHTRRVLEGGVKDSAALHPSLKLIPGRPQNKHPLSGEVENLNEHQQCKRYPGGITDYFPAAGRTEPCPARTFTPHVIPPISSYTITPQLGVLSAPGYEVRKTPGSSDLTTATPGYADFAPSTHGGVTTWVPGFAAEHHSPTTSASTDSSFSPVTEHGVTTWIPGFSVTTNLSGGGSEIGKVKSNGITVWVPGYEVSSPSNTVTTWVPGHQSSTLAHKEISSAGAYGLASSTSKNGLTSWVPGYGLTTSVSRNGVVCWAPGYEVTVASAGIAKSTLGGIWYTAPKNQAAAGLRASPAQLTANRERVEAVVAAQPLIASALLLPELKRSSVVVTWDEWYRRVGRAIYERWQDIDEGPGTATVLVTVTREHQVSCLIDSFFPAPGIERNVTRETAFRESAVRTIDALTSADVPAFPSLSAWQQVTFAVELKRTVDGPIGFKVIAAPPPASFSVQQAR